MKIINSIFLLLITLLIMQCNNDETKHVKKVRVSAIVVPSEIKAQEVQEKLKNNEDFSDLVHEYSIGPNIIDGGDLGFIVYDDMGLELRNAINDIKIGKYSEYVLYNNQYYILLKTDEKNEEIKKEEGKAEESENFVTERKDYMPPSNSFITLLPFMVISLFFAILNFIIAPRKGKNRYLFLILTLIPIIGMLSTIYLISLADIELLNRIGRIENLLEEIKKEYRSTV